MSKLSKCSAAILLILLGALGTFSASTVYVGTANASAASLILPTKSVTIEAFNGTNSFFITNLTNVPAGYDVTNTSYLGWCIDRTAEMARSPATHQAMLYSSLNPPAAMANQTWDMVNYVLNHKQGTKSEIQNALWYFINMKGGYTDFTSETSWAMINDAQAHGKGFVPDSKQITAVICYPVRLFSTDTSVQISIIEVISNGSNGPSNTSPQNTQSNNSPQTTWYIIAAAAVVIALVIASSAVLLRRRSKLKRD